MSANDPKRTSAVGFCCEAQRTNVRRPLRLLPPWFYKFQTDFPTYIRREGPHCGQKSGRAILARVSAPPCSIPV